MAELERPELLAIARANVIRLRIKQNLQWKEIAKLADVSEDVLNNLSRGKPVSDLVLARVATVLGTDLEHLFYNTPDEQAGAPVPPQGQEDWRESIREIERYVRSIEDPIERLATVRRLLAVARANVEDYERGVDRAAAPGRAQGGDAPAPGVRPGRAGRALK